MPIPMFEPKDIGLCNRCTRPLVGNYKNGLCGECLAGRTQRTPYPSTFRNPALPPDPPVTFESLKKEWEQNKKKIRDQS